jgi:DNA-binding MarR family transcriptional regulator
MSETLAHLLDRLGRAVHNLQYADGLNPAQWEALRFLSRANRYSRKPSALADYLGTTKGTVSQTVKALEDKGLIKRAVEARDRRIVRLELSDEGQAMLAKDPLLALSAATACAPEEVATATRILSGYVRSLQGQCGMKSFGVCSHCGHFTSDVCDDGVVPRCGLTGEPLSDTEIKKICGSCDDQSDGSQPPV